MKRVRFCWSLWAIGLALLDLAAPLAAAEPLELRDGDRVVLLGGTLFDRDRLYSEPVGCNGRENSLRLNLPPLAGVVLRKT